MGVVKEWVVNTVLVGGKEGVSVFILEKVMVGRGGWGKIVCGGVG